MACKYTYKGITYSSKEEFISQVINPQFLSNQKIRRVMELQSDLFQKGRDLDDLIYKSTERNNRTYDEAQERKKEQLNQNQFLQLLNKDNNWVNFFIKSIIQDSAKKRYEKVLFPTGNTASKVEGHTTLEEFKKQKEDRIKQLELYISDKEKLNDFSLDDQHIFKDNEKYYLDSPYNERREITEKEFIEIRNEVSKNSINEISQLKQELERVEREGFGALKPIYNFYENTVTNILNKTYGKDNVKVIADEYGNTWNEIVIDEKTSDEQILLKEIDFNDIVDENAIPLTSDQKNEAQNIGDTNKLLFNNESGAVTVDSVLKNIQNNLDENLSPQAKFLIDKAIKLSGKSKTKVTFVDESFLKTENTVMQYDAKTDTIFISKKRLEKYSSQTAVVAFLHEIVHGQTVQALSKPESERTFAEQRLYEVVMKFMNKYKGSALEKEYGFKNRFEFVAEFYANPEFREAVKEISDAWWRELLKAIGGLFNLVVNREYLELTETIVNFVEEEYNDYDGINRYGGIFEARLVKDSKFVSLEDKLSNTISKAQDTVDSLEKRASAALRAVKRDRNLSTVDKNKKIKERKAYLDNIRSLKKELELQSNAKKWKAIIAYVKSFGKAISQVEKMIVTLESKTNATDEEITLSLNHFEDYLGSYDLLSDINEISQKAKKDLGTLNTEELQDFNEIRNFLKEYSEKHDYIKSRFIEVKKEIMSRMLSNSVYNTEIEVKHREFLGLEWEKLTDKQGLSKNEYISRMIATRDFSDFQSDLEAAANSLTHDPLMDITATSLLISDSININSRIIQVVNNIIAEARDGIIKIFKAKDIALLELNKKLINLKGNVRMSKLNENLIERDSEGNVYLRGMWSIKYKDAYLSQYMVTFNEYEAYKAEEIEKGRTLSQIKVDAKSQVLVKKLMDWRKENEDFIPSIVPGGKSTRVPKRSKYLNKKLSTVEQEVLDAYIKINEDNVKRFDGHGYLIERVSGFEFHKIPTSEKQGLERRLELDVKGQTIDKIKELYKVRVDDIGTQSKSEAIDYKGQIIKHLKPLYRGKIDPKNQSLDLNTLFRNELFNGLEFEKNLKLKPKLELISDVVKQADVHVRQVGQTTKLLNRFKKRNPNVAVEGSSTNLHKKLIGIMERELYHLYSRYAGTIAGIDANQAVNAINGYAATLSMSFNFVSAGANLANGFTNLFIESFGGDVIKRNTLLKAEARYTKELMNGSLLSDLNNPIKKSYFNQLLEMFDVMGGLSLVQQESLRNSVDRKIASFKQLNVLNETGEHMMHSILTEAILDGIKVMNSDNKYIDKEGNETTKEKAASISDMLYTDRDGLLKISDKVVYSDFNLATKYSEGGKVHVNMLIKSKVFDIFGVYDVRFKSELAKTLIGKLTLMFKNFFVSAAEYRYTGFGSSLKKKEDLLDEELFYNSAKKEYIEGTYTTFVRFFKHSVIPSIKAFKLAYIAENYNSLTEYEKSNLKKASLEFALTSLILPIIGFILKAGAGDGDDDKAWYFILVLRRLEQEMSQFRNVSEAGKMISNPVAGTRFFNHAYKVVYDILTPINVAPVEGESVFGYLDKNNKDEYKMVNDIFKITPVLNRNSTYKQQYGLQFSR